MPRLQILQHKSYHPYLEKNKQRVREDEAKAAAEELAREQKRIDGESSARLDLLRRRANSPTFASDPALADGDLPSTSSTRDKGDSLLERHRREKARVEKKERKARDRLDFDFPTDAARRAKGKERVEEGGRARPGGTSQAGVEQGEDDEAQVRGDTRTWESGGHLNFLADIENAPTPSQPTLAELAKKKKDQESDPFTMYLGRPEKETKPWYTDRELKRVDEKETGEEAEERRARDRRKDARSKNRNDPLTHVNSLLSLHPSSNPSFSTSRSRLQGAAPADPQAARLAREQSERQRALALIAKSKAPQRIWDDTPSTVAGRSWGEALEREKDRAGMRYFNSVGDGGRGGNGLWERRGKVGGRSWEV